MIQKDGIAFFYYFKLNKKINENKGLNCFFLTKWKIH
jgi:hypothetical protein